MIEQAGQRLGVALLRVPVLQCQWVAISTFPGITPSQSPGHQVDHRIDERLGERSAAKERVRRKLGVAFPPNPKRPEALDEVLGAFGGRCDVITGAKTDEVAVLVARRLDALSGDDGQVRRRTGGAAAQRSSMELVDQQFAQG